MDKVNSSTIGSLTDAPVKGQVISQENGRMIYLTSNPRLTTSPDGTDNMYIATGVIGKNSRCISVLVMWKLTPTYKTALSVFCDADKRDETTEAIIGDLDGAAEWDKPSIFKV